MAEEPQHIEEGDMYVVLGKKVFMDDLDRADMGQKVLIRFVEERKSRAGRDYKYIIAKLGPMDETYAKPAEEEEDIPFGDDE